MTKHLAAVAVLTLAVATPAAAQQGADVEPFTGANLVVLGGVDDREIATADPQFLYGASIGYDAAAGRARFGVELEASGATGRSCSFLNGSPQLCNGNGRDLYAGARGGVVAGPVLIYGKLGYSNARVRADGVANGFLYRSHNLNGLRLGAGVEYQVGRLLARAEYRYSDYGGLSGNQGVIGVGFRF